MKIKNKRLKNVLVILICVMIISVFIIIARIVHKKWGCPTDLPISTMCSEPLTQAVIIIGFTLTIAVAIYFWFNGDLNGK